MSDCASGSVVASVSKGMALSGGTCYGIPTENSYQGSHQMASTPWTSFGNRLFKRGNAFFIRVRIRETFRTSTRRRAGFRRSAKPLRPRIGGKRSAAVAVVAPKSIKSWAYTLSPPGECPFRREENGPST